ncbi:helix-turn-helix domain-containing protein [Bacillus sp. S0628]|uniref:helix-turn-helix domain-containing protein n=1 Tax=Bacillus sp. S0628 TaxID=2957802 RepID=UPI00209CF4B3|nr:helix-turn-helix domain-containing protein [Bacillus sp. S0628]MCP1324242.1 helix-turn-helix domain-containing protein [Bacillus sp. S0628]
MARPDGYDVEGYIHFIEKRVDGDYPIDEKDGIRKMPNKEAYEVPFSYLESLNLDKVGNEIPSRIHSMWNVDRYMAYYWKQIMDADCIFVWQHLWEYCDKESAVDICYPKMTELAQRCGLSKGTLISKIKKLEENNFLIQVHRLNKRNGNREDSPVFKLRGTIPLLSQEQYKQLKPFMQKKHDEFMEKFASDSQMDRFNRHNGEDTINSLIDTVGDKIVSKKDRKEIETLLENQQEKNYILTNIPSYMQDTLATFNELEAGFIRNGCSKPTAEVFFQDIIAIYDRETHTAHIIARDDSKKEFLEKLDGNMKDILFKTLDGVYESIGDVKYFTAKQYIVSILKSK